jgi:arylsulfatase A-like enzyme
MPGAWRPRYNPRRVFDRRAPKVLVATLAAAIAVTLVALALSSGSSGEPRGERSPDVAAVPLPRPVERSPDVAAVPVPRSVEPAPAPPREVPYPKRVLIISEDGMRPDVLTTELAPNHVELMREGESARNAHTIPQSDTLPSHASMLSGVGAAEHGLWWNSFKGERGYIHVPTIFSVAHAHGLSTAMIVGKPKLRHIAIPGTVDHYERPSYLCGGVAKRVAHLLATAPPDLLFVHFSDPDEYGHSHGWMSREYLRAVRHSDHCLGTVLGALDDAGLADTTLVIVTADHGGHGIHHSGGHTDLDRAIPWIARGPGALRGAELETSIATVDTAATALAALRLPPLPQMRGSPRLAFASSRGN